MNARKMVLTWLLGMAIIVQMVKYSIDLFIVGDIARHGDFSPAFSGHFCHAVVQLVVLVGKGEFGTLPLHGLGDTPGDGSVTGESYDECAFTA